MSLLLDDIKRLYAELAPKTPEQRTAELEVPVSIYNDVMRVAQPRSEAPSVFDGSIRITPNPRLPSRLMIARDVHRKPLGYFLAGIGWRWDEKLAELIAEMCRYP